MKRFLYYFSLFVVLAVFSSCGGKKSGKGLLTPTSSGRAYEILVIIIVTVLKVLIMVVIR